MGRKTPNTNNGQLFIQTDQPFYMAGDNVTGKVFFNLSYPFDSEILYLSIKGYEDIFFEEQRTRTEGSGDDTRQVVYYVPFEQKNTFLKTSVPLRQWPGQNLMPAGQYTFPFAFPLQPQLPGTFFEESPGSQQPRYKGVVKYKVKAYLTGARGEKMKITQPIVIREPLKQTVEGQFKESLVKPTTWCCIGQGESNLKCYFEKNVYTPGETARLKAEIDNSKCNLDITDLTCYLIKTLHLKADGHDFNRSEDIQKNVCQGVKANEKAVGDQCRYCEIVINKSNSKEAQPSTNGKLIQCTYSLRSLANLDGCICCSSEPEITVPISVTSLPPPNFQFFQPPPNWNPQVFPVVNVAVPYQQQQYPSQMPPPQMGQNNPPMGQPQQQYPNPAEVGQYPNQLNQQPYPNQGQQPPQAVPTYPNQQQQQQQYQQPVPPNQPYNQPQQQQQQQAPYNQPQQQQQQQVPINPQQALGNPLQNPQQQGQLLQNNQEVPKPYVDKPPEVDHRPQMAPPAFDQYPPNNNNPMIPNNGNFNNQGGQNIQQQAQNQQGLREINNQPLQGGIVKQEMSILQSVPGSTPTPQSGFPMAQPQNNNNYPPSGQQQQFGGPGQIPNQQNNPGYPQQGIPPNGFNNGQPQPGQQGQYNQPLQPNDVILQNNPNQNPQQQLLSQQNNPAQQQQGGYPQQNQGQQGQQNQGNFPQGNNNNNFGNQNFNQNFQNQPNYGTNQQQNFGGPGNQYPQQGQFFQNPSGEQQRFVGQQGAQR